MKNRSIWNDRRVPRDLDCPNCSGTNVAVYDYTDADGHRYSCQRCNSVVVYTTDQVNKEFFRELRHRQSA